MEDDIYHYDFTTASELEVFIAHLEEIIQDWGLHQKPIEEPLQKGYFKSKEWCSSTANLTFSGYNKKSIVKIIIINFL